MTRPELIAINTTLRNAVDDIEDLVDDVELPGQSGMNMAELDEHNEELADVLREVVMRATAALDELDDDDEGEGEDENGAD